MSGHILELSSNVERKRVVYCNRYGLEITGELYYGKGADLNQKVPAVLQFLLHSVIPVSKQPLNEVPGDIPEPGAEWFRFYAVKRGHHPHARGGFTTTSDLAMMNFRLLDYITEISPRPILFVIGDRAHSRFFSEDAYQAALEPKEMYVVEDAEHIDLYDRRDRIPFEILADFFGTKR